jgi:glycosyltransferase involved in cell wall biosynthesis
VKMCCVVSSLGAGGAERVLSLLANAWMARGCRVAIVTLTGVSGDAYALDHRVERVGLDLEIESRSPVHAIVNNLRKTWGLRRAVASLAPDVVVSFVDRMNVLTLLACAGLPVPVIVSERVHPGHLYIGGIWSLLRRLMYRRADGLVVQSEASRSWAEAVVRARRTHVIPNPVGDRFTSGQGGGEAGRRPIVLAVGRLVPQKGFDLLIEAFAAVAPRHPEWSLVIVGQGPEEPRLRRLAGGLLGQGAVVFQGVVSDPERYYRAAGLFVLPSRFEGFPNALLEAMACGCAVIAADCPAGPGEIVRHGIDGSLVPSEDLTALTTEMDRLMGDAMARRRLGARAGEVSERFDIEKILNLWEDVIADVRR